MAGIMAVVMVVIEAVAGLEAAFMVVIDKTGSIFKQN
jgi:hypothetical protein